MTFKKISRLFHTVKYLKLKQIIYRIYYVLRDKIYSKSYPMYDYENDVAFLKFYSYYNPSSSVNGKSFKFLNKEKRFEKEIDWNFALYGKLWTYNLNYFDFLNQTNISKEQGLALILDYISKNSQIKDGFEPYPISLRSVNWIKFLSQHKIKDPFINGFLKNNYTRLLDNLEYHLLGNHLLENAFALLWGSYFFKNEKYYQKAYNLLIDELDEQILEDGAHFELSPMYHQTMFYRVLDCLFLVENNTWKSDDLKSILRAKANSMRSFLINITYDNGQIPMLNDSTYDIAPSTEELLSFASTIGIREDLKIELGASGYRKLSGLKHEIFIDVGPVGASYQPAHAHADTLNFEININKKPIIVDRGISTYNKNAIRFQERSTSSHNTVCVNNREQSDVWGGFRVGKRATVKIKEDNKNTVVATHSGYKDIGVIHQRTFISNPLDVIIEDQILSEKQTTNIAAFHFHPDIRIEQDNNSFKVQSENVEILFSGHKDIVTTSYNFSKGFNKTEEAVKLEVIFDQKLKSQIKTV